MPFYETAMLPEVGGNIQFRYFYGICFQILRKQVQTSSRELFSAGLSSQGCKEVMFLSNLCANSKKQKNPCNQGYAKESCSSNIFMALIFSGSEVLLLPQYHYNTDTFFLIHKTVSSSSTLCQGQISLKFFSFLRSAG